MLKTLDNIFLTWCIIVRTETFWNNSLKVGTNTDCLQGQNNLQYVVNLQLKVN